MADDWTISGEFVWYKTSSTTPKTRIRLLAPSMAHVKEFYEHTFNIETGIIDQAVPLGGIVNANILIISTDFDIDVKLNGSAVDIPVGNKGPFTLMDTNITSLSISNDSGSVARVSVYAYSTEST